MSESISMQTEKRKSGWRRLRNLLLWVFGSLVVLVLANAALLAWTDGDPARLAEVSAFWRSPWMLLLRLPSYALLWHFWPRLLRRFDPGMPDGLIQASRRPLLITLVAYELLFANNILAYLF